ncbi:hypothetical protein NQ314_005316 [Rhamnusium bicolor]|uniref:Uncharacterized protein n=1 Tax=Rhamnusium bicolor TaxID=1586634 RepID=A0AAV8ZIF9_9CUCU|nr:hypothetical protein NQ314_005316 [Rhamnusium bicolor]
MKCSPKIIVSWHSANEDDSVAKRTFIHAYQLAPDYQTVSNIYDIEPVDHYVSSLHNIEDCDNLIMGCGENKITLWNVEYGYIVATIELSEIKSPLSTLLRGVCIDNGLLLSFYDQGILCWKAETGEPVEETNLETEIIPSGKYVILMEDNQILVKHAITHLMSMSVEDT